MTTPLGDDVTAMTLALIESAKRLGLTWTLRLATVSDGSDLAAIVATYDGDTVAIAMTSMVGPLTSGQRVYVLQVPPSGNFIVGLAGLDWITPTLLNSWVNTSGAHQTTRFRKTAAGQVEIQGLVSNGTGPASTIFTLPSGYRPAATVMFAVIANNAVARLDIEADGDIVWQAGGTNAFLSLNCTFTPAT